MFQKGHTGHKKVIYTDDTKVDDQSDIILKDGTLAVGGNQIQGIDRPLNADYLDELAFNEEFMEIMVQESSDENALNPIRVGVNNVFQDFYRGIPIVTRRKFVNGLIVKSGRVTTPEDENRRGGERTFLIRQKSALEYPFMVINDDNPKGREWLTRRLAEVV